MKRILILYLLIVTCHAAGQEIPSDHFYKHMTGNINKTIDINLNIIRAADSVFGNYFYYFPEHETHDNSQIISKTITLTGKMSSPTEFILEEINNKESVFNGLFTSKNRAEGTWENPENDKVLTFELFEKYPSGSIPFNLFNYESNKRLVQENNSPIATIKLLCVVPGEYPNNDIKDSVTRIINNAFFNTRVKTKSTLELIQNEADRYFTHYIDANRQLYDGGSSFNWIKKKSTNILFNDAYVTTIEFENYGYTGGAHGLRVNKYIVIDLFKGEQVIIDELFIKGAKKQLLELINKKIRKEYDIKTEQSFSGAGFFYDTIPVTNNFYINKDGIGFYYNNYDIASYFIGHTNVFIHYSEINRYIDMSSPAGRIYNLFSR